MNKTPTYIKNFSKPKNKIKCEYCQIYFITGNISRHRVACKDNPANLISCMACNKSFVPKYKGVVTCSHSCSNTYFRTGPNNGNWKSTSYRTTCFHYHKKECVVCGENKIVTVHHLDEDRKNNSPDNLIPLCPTHHQYWHSRHKEDVYDVVMSYINEWKKSNP